MVISQWVQATLPSSCLIIGMMALGDHRPPQSVFAIKRCLCKQYMTLKLHRRSDASKCLSPLKITANKIETDTFCMGSLFLLCL